MDDMMCDAYDDDDLTSCEEYNSDIDGGDTYDDYGAEDDAADDYYGCESDDDDDDNGKVNKHNQPRYTILSEEDIRQRQEDDISNLSTVLTISQNWASILLRNYQWSVDMVQDQWFADEDRVRQTVGFLEESVVGAKNPIAELIITCGICFEPCCLEIMHSAACGHQWCQTCWVGYISTSINDGPGCLFLRCPEPGCRAAIDQDMIDKLATDEDKKKYSRYLLRSYIEADRRKKKWCPAPGCDFAVEFYAGDVENFDISCVCSHSFCWSCNEESHRPVVCETVSKWLIKNSSEAENVDWLLVNTKPCPKCNRSIEKNQGCMHMTCSSPCKYQFCWLCLGKWSTHGEKTGGYYNCNIYTAAREDGLFNEEDAKRERAEQSLEKYVHYYERWTNNQSSRKKALADLHKMQTENFEKLSYKYRAIASELKLITDAWLQIIECRRVLTWTYAYGYYLPEDEHAKKEFFEYLQGHAESELEKLHQCAEEEVQKFLPTEEGSSNGTEDMSSNGTFHDLLIKLSVLTKATKTYFDNLVSALENGLSDVPHGAYGCQPACSKGKKSKAGRRKGTSNS